MAERALVTGVLGCLGAWTARALLDEGLDVVGFDLGDANHRLELVLGPHAGRVDVIGGDITDRAALERALDEREITRVVHLAALQVPFCRENPVLGASVNVVGTVNVFEAVGRRLDRIPGVAYASSAAVYGPSDPSPAPESGGLSPTTHYGVFKQANEGTARIAWQDDGVPSIGIRPFVVYGAGRDQGLTSGPTAAMAAAVRGESFTIGYGGLLQYDFAPDVGLAFARASSAATRGSLVANFPGVAATMPEVVAAIEKAAPEASGKIDWEDVTLPFPAELEATALVGAIGPLPHTPLDAGVAATVAHFRRAS